MFKRTLSDCDNDDENSNRRMSLPAKMKQGETNLETTPLLQPSNRRHTLMPLRSILKSTNNENFSITNDRRVSFAGQVSVHKFRVSNSPRKKQRTSLQSPLVPVKLSIHEYMKKRANGQTNDTVQHAIDEMEGESLEKQARIDKEIADLHARKYQHTDEIHEDNSTQTMEMSVELTNQIKEQQTAVAEQSGDHFDDVEDHEEETDSFRELFEDLDDDDNNDNDNNETNEMELTQPVLKVPVLESPQLERAILAADESVTMEFTQPVKPILLPEEIENQDMELTQPINKPIVVSVERDQSLAQLDDVTESMDFTVPIAQQTNHESNEIDTPQSTVNFTPASNVTQIFSETNECDETENMELTVPVRQVSQEEQEPELTFNPTILSMITEGSETTSGSDATSNGEFQGEPNVQNVESTPLQANHAPVESTPVTTQSELQKENRDNEAIELNNQANTDNMDSSGLELSFATELVPLAEVSDNSLHSDNFESADILEDDDNYVNVPLDKFLKDINVQFYDSIGPSDKEIEGTLELKDVDQNGSSNSPSSSATASAESTPSQISEEKRQTLLDYIDASNNILYYHYLNHIINQYRASINTISNMVEKFSDDVQESNLLTMREYYIQIMELRSDLRTNYQAIASFARKQSQNENMQFISGLLDQLISSYDKSKIDLNVELENAIEWRKTVLLGRQQMIEKKMELSKLIENLQKLKNEWTIVDIPKLKDVNSQIKLISKENVHLKFEIKQAIEHNEDIKNQLSEMTAQKIGLVKKINDLKNDIKSMEAPIDTELNELTNQLQQLELKTGIRLISSSPFEFTVIDDLGVTFDDKVSIDILHLSNFKPFESFANSFVLRVISIHGTLPPFQFLKTLKKEWLEFKQIWKDLTTLYYIYPTMINEDGFTIDLGLPNGKLELKFTFEGLLNDSKNIRVAVTGSLDLNEVKSELKNGIWGKLGLFKRLDI